MKKNYSFLLLALFLILACVGAANFGGRYLESYKQALSADLYSKFAVIKEIKGRLSVIKQRQSEIRMIFVGDMMFSRGVGQQMERNNNFSFPFAKVSEFLQSADLVFGNLEGPIATRGENQGSIYSFKADPRSFEGLNANNFKVVSVANNHIWDYGIDALKETVALLGINNIDAVGAGNNYEEANKLAIQNIKDTKIGFLAYTNLYQKSLVATGSKAGVSNFNVDAIKEKIRQAKQSGSVDLLVVSLHWGEEYAEVPTDYQKNIAREFIDAGADLIVGHHPHVVQETENYKTGWIFYSLGNFIFDQNFSEETMSGLAAEVVIKNKSISDVVFSNIKINKSFQPELVDENAGAALQ